MFKVVFVRHGESEYNVLKKCAGWLDCSLTTHGVAQARDAGRLLKDGGFVFDVAYSSELKRAVCTRDLLLQEMDLACIPVHRSWRLNERHYGGLDDLSKEEAECRFGEETVRLCREDFTFRPPGSTEVSAGVDPESMRDATTRCAWYWQTVIAPAVRDGTRAVVVAHGDILRLLCGRLLGMTEHEIVHSPVAPNAAPFVFEFNDDFGVVDHYYLAQSADLTSLLVAP